MYFLFLFGGVFFFMQVVAQHADEDGNEADRLANDRADECVVNIVDQPCGRGDQAELAGAAGIL